ncbi:MAG: hypothetical protein ACYDBQ_02295 [Thermoplasmatota archaeon]
MRTTTKVALVTVAVAIPAFLLAANGPIDQATGLWGNVWPFHKDPMAATPTGLQIPLFIFLSLAEATSFGLAVSFVSFGWPLVKRVAAGGRRAQLAVFWSAAWVLGNWWLHDSLHATNSANLWSLLVIEYTFHLTLIVAGATLCFQLYRAWTMADSRTMPVTGARGVVAVKAR